MQPMYHAAIADDEIGIYEGLQELVDWEALGFSLEGAFEDGEGLLSLLKKSPPDLIITDIRMNHCSGLDISKYIQEHRLPTKVILISGYKEVDLAMSAIKYGVKDYILKPIDLDELIACIKKIRTELDAAASISHQKTELNQAKNDMQNLLKLFFDEVLQGSLQNKRMIRRMLELLYPGLSCEDCACFFFSLCTRQYHSFVHTGLNHDPNDIARYIDSFSVEEQSHTKLRAISRKPGCFSVFGILTGPGIPSLKAAIEKDITLLCEKIRTVFSISAWTIDLQIFPSISEMLKTVSFRHETAEDPSREGSETPPCPLSGSAFHDGINLAEQTRNYIIKHIGEDISLEDVSEYFYFSSSHFSRVFKSQTGETFVRFVSKCKMDYAARLLATTDLKVYDVCEQVGYRSLRHFNKLFKAHTGMQPSIYRQRMHMGDFYHEP